MQELETGALAMMIPIVGIVLGIGIGFWAIYWDYRTKQLKYRERVLMIEKGLTPPPLVPDKTPATPEDCLRRGTIMLFLGIGLAIGYFILLRFEGPPDWICGLGAAIVGLLGVGNLVYYFIARKRTPEGPQSGNRVIIS